MPTNVRGAFSEFAARLEPTDLQRADATIKHTGVKDCLNSQLWIETAFLTGSYARWTIIRPPNDIDIFIVLDYSKHAEYYQLPNGVDLVLERFHGLLKGCYPNTPIRKDHPAIHLAFSTYGFDVVPAFKRKGGGFVIPSHFGSGWLSTDPEKHATRTTGMNAATGGYFVPMVKMFKSWNRAHFDKLTGFHLEMALADSWPQTQQNSFPFSNRPTQFTSFAAAAAALFPALSDHLYYQTPDPAGFGAIDSYLSMEDRNCTRERLKSAGYEAQIALRHDFRGDHYSAVTKWREIFGDQFPSYS
jgi:hypothetical protein